MTPADIIYSQIPIMTRACLDMKRSNCYSDSGGRDLVASGVVVQALDSCNQRGEIRITLTPADLYDVKFTPNRGDVQEFEGLDAEQMIELLYSRTVGPR